MSRHEVLWFCAALLALVLLAAGLWWRSRAKLPWQPLPKYFSAARWFCDPGVKINAAQLVRALYFAESCLILHTRWDASALALVGHYVRVHVRSSGFKLPRPRTTTFILSTDETLASLCHELAHLCEMVVDGTVDPQHREWEQRGVTAALAEYDAWLNRRGWSASTARFITCRLGEPS